MIAWLLELFSKQKAKPRCLPPSMISATTHKIREKEKPRQDNKTKGGIIYYKVGRQA